MNAIKVVQCWDDGVVDDIRLIEILRKHRAKASFNLKFGYFGAVRDEGWNYRDVKRVSRLAKSEIRDVYEGFLVANHGFTHPHLPQIPIDEAVSCIRQGKDALEQHFGYPVTGFAYPFGDYNPEIMEVICEAGHAYARTADARSENADGKVSPQDDPMALHPHCHFLAPDFYERLEQVKAVGGVFYFWGHSYELVVEQDWADFDAKICRLNSDPAVEWANLPDVFRIENAGRKCRD